VESAAIVLLLNLMVEQQMPDVEADVHQLSVVFGALADPTRRAIVRRLASGDATVGQLAEPFPMSFQAVSKHVRVLEHAGLVTRSRRGQQRPCRLRVQPLASANGWLGDFRQLWERSFDRIDEHLMKKEEPR
jgi:DNA-binding transcriptional ArsR family regulator